MDSPVGNTRNPGPGSEGEKPPVHSAPPEDPSSPAIRPGLLKYCFTLRATLAQTFVGDIPGGVRVDVQYDPAQALRFDFPTVLEADEVNVLDKAELISGNDWVSVSWDGIATFDTRITLRIGGGVLKDPKDRCVISANLRGRADLGNVRTKNGKRIITGSNRSAIVEKWKEGFDAGAYVPLTLSATFDVPVEGDNKAQNQVYESCRGLERGFFIAAGRATCLSGRNSPLDSIRVDFLRVAAPSWATGAEDGSEKRLNHLAAAKVQAIARGASPGRTGQAS